MSKPFIVACLTSVGAVLMLSGNAPFVSVRDASAQSTESGKQAEGKSGEESEEEVVKTGTIASTGNYGFGPQAITSGSGAAPGDEPGVITAGVSRKSRDECTVTLKNASEKNGYSASYRVVEYNNTGSKVSSRYYSASLEPKGSKTQDVPCRQGNSVQVELSSARPRK